MQDQVGLARLVQRRGERVDDLVGQLADEADGVGQQVRTAVDAQLARRRVERVEEAVADADLGAGQAVEQRRLAGVRVAGERDLRQVRALALGAHRRARGADALQPAAQRGDPVARQPAVGLDLRLARSAGADAGRRGARAEALEVRPQPPHAGHVVLELRELDLQLALGAVRVAGEDVEDHARAVDDRHAELLLEVALLARAELVVADDDVGVGELGGLLDLLDLAGPDVGVRVRLLEVLDDLPDDRDAGRAQQLAQLGEVVSGCERGDAERPLLRAPGLRFAALPDLAGAALSGSLHAVQSSRACAAGLTGSAPAGARSRDPGTGPASPRTRASDARRL